MSAFESIFDRIGRPARLVGLRQFSRGAGCLKAIIGARHRNPSPPRASVAPWGAHSPLLHYSSCTIGLRVSAEIVDQDVNADQEDPKTAIPRILQLMKKLPIRSISASENPRKAIQRGAMPVRITTVDVEIMNTAAILIAYTFTIMYETARAKRKVAELISSLRRRK